LATSGRAILDQYRTAVVTIKLVIKEQWSSGGQSRDQEDKKEITGTVIDPSGLTVVSLSDIDPALLIEAMMAAQGRNTDDFKMTSQITDLKILLSDGAEVPGQVVLRDKDLDLAFIRPKEQPKEPMKAVPFDQSAPVQLLDPVVTLNRLGRVASREYAASIERVQAVVTKPRTFYLLGFDPTHTGLGSPAFTADGKVVGLCVIRTSKGGEVTSRGMGGGMEDMMSAIVLPAADVLEVAKQAPQKGEEPPAPAPEQSAPAAEQAPEPPKEGTPAPQPPAEAPPAQNPPAENPAPPK
jgi:S1-C subfamily serine protease